MPNDLPLVHSVTRLLEEHGIVTWLFGGWAEELLGLMPPRPHKDIDLLYRASDFTDVDRFLRMGQATEIREKRFVHKRAFLFNGVMVELLLVKPDLTTDFWGKRLHTWPADTLEGSASPLRIASPLALITFRESHGLRQ
jgi:hypothetical protein